MTFEEAKKFIHATGNLSRPGLERMEELMKLLGNPEQSLKFIHVAGTNGKGSICAMLSSVLESAGYRTGLYVSPHLTRITERMQVNGKEISEADFAAMAAVIAPAIEKMADKPTEFERLTAMALLYFAQQKCDIVVFEVGLGGRLDATNIITTPELSVIAHIGLEHTEWLGDTIERIAFEKGGIIKENCPTVLYHQSIAAEQVIDTICAERHSKLHISDEAIVSSRSIDGQTLSYKSFEKVTTPLLGTYQIHNAAAALEAIAVLREKGWHISDDAVAQGMAKSAWPARLEVLQRKPLILLDGAHNPNGVEALAQSLQTILPEGKWLFVMGVMADKDYRQMLSLIAPLAKAIIAAQPDYYRALSSQKLKEVIGKEGSIPVYDGGDIPSALALAQEKANGSPICVFGSLYQAGEVRAFFGKE